MRFCHSSTSPQFETGSTMSTINSPADPPKITSLASLDSKVDFIHHLCLFWIATKASTCLGPTSSPCLTLAHPPSGFSPPWPLSPHALFYLLLKTLTSNCGVFNKPTLAFPLIILPQTYLRQFTAIEKMSSLSGGIVSYSFIYSLYLT